MNMKKIALFICFAAFTLGAWSVPERWKVFPTVHVGYKVPDEYLKMIPASIGKCNGEYQTLKNGRFDLSKLTRDKSSSHCFWAFAELDMPRALRTKIGAGADWFLTLYVNGEKVIDSMESGNTTAVQLDSFIADIDLKKGKNILVMKVMRGSRSAAAVIGSEKDINRLKAEFRRKNVPFILEPKKSFDPVKEKWKLVFSDEFDGNRIDWNKWRPKAKRDISCLALDGKGHLLVSAKYNKKGKLEVGEMFSKPNFKYGYFEARVKFTRQPGWWSSFWLYGYSNRNAMLDGVEIDTFEDYFFRPRSKYFKPSTLLDHNFHIYSGNHLHSSKYSALVPDEGQFHVIGCKWTPFEITIYRNGKAITAGSSQSPWQQVTFDAINHGTGVTPLHVVLNGNSMFTRPHMRNRSQNGRMPEHFVVDYVRVYAYPDGNDPKVGLVNTPEAEFVKPGSRVKVSVKPVINKNTQAPILRSYLFDNGLFIKDNGKAPWGFDIPFTAEFYSKTKLMARSRKSGKKNVFDACPHAYSVFVQDARGNVGHSRVFIRIPYSGKLSRPYQGKAQKIPGKLKLSCFDEGGQGIAYYDTSRGNTADPKLRGKEDVDVRNDTLGDIRGGEYIHYTVDIAKAGKYRVTVPYGTPYNGTHKIWVFVDLKLADVITFNRKEYSWGCSGRAVLRNLFLPAGRHRITLMMSGGFNIADIVFSPENN